MIEWPDDNQLNEMASLVQVLYVRMNSYLFTYPRVYRLDIQCLLSSSWYLGVLPEGENPKPVGLLSV